MAGDFQHKENSGSAFPNDRKTQPNHPDYKGSANIGGVEYWVSGWVKQSAKGKFLSMAFQPKDGGFGGVTSGGLDEVPVKKSDPKPGPSFDDISGDIPF